MIEHLPECTQASLAELHPDEERPDHLSEVAWHDMKFCDCAPGCPVMEQAKARGRELAEEYGW